MQTATKPTHSLPTGAIKSRPSTSRFRWLLAVLVVGAAFTLRAERLPIKIYTTADGLAHNTVNRIVRDSRGFLWFCTAEGLSRFDGYSFINFGIDEGLPHSNVTDLLETRAGNYWVATEGGLVRFDPKGRPGSRMGSENQVSAPPMFSIVLPIEPSRRSDAITVLREGRDGTIWAGTNDGLYRLEQSDGRPRLGPVDIHIPNDFPEQRTIADVLEDAHGSLWVASPSGLYRRWPDGSAARYTERDGLPSSEVQDLLEDHEGHLWAGTRRNGFFSFSADATHGAPVVGLEITERDRSGLPNDWVVQLFEGSDHRFWVATVGGLSEFLPAGDTAGRHFRTYASGNGSDYSDITALNEDLGGNLWLGTYASGAMKWARNGFRTFGEQDGIEMVHAIFEDRSGHVCFKGAIPGSAGTAQPIYESRLGCFDGERFEWFRPSAVTVQGWGTDSARPQVTLQARQGDWWVGTSEGLYRFPPADHLEQLATARPLAVYTTRAGLTVSAVSRLFEDFRGNVWVATASSTASGLGRWEPDTETVRDLTRSPGLPSFEEDRPGAFGEDRSGNVWIGFSSGLVRYRADRFEWFTARDGLPPGAIVNIYVDHSGRTWLASAGGGLVRVDDPGEPRPVFVSYTTKEGLSSNNAEVITEDLTGRLYIGGGRGLDRFDQTTRRITHFTAADGVVPGKFEAAFCDHGGVLWFGTTNGLARLAPAAAKIGGQPPVLITGLRVRGLAQTVSALGERDMSLSDLAPDQNQLQIDFVGLGFGSGGELRYQYRLDGADADWSEPGEQRTIEYARIAPGRYTFLVRAVNSDGIVSAQPASVAFRILRPVWQRSWFLGLAVLAIGLAVYALDRYRIARLLEMANMRTRIATDLHDDIGANLTRIALLSETAQRGRDKEPGPDGPLSSIARIARESVASMSDIVWAINPARDSLLDLTRRMRQHAEELFTLREIELRFDAPGASQSVKLGVDIRRDLLLIFKEAVNNCARHACCSRVAIDLYVESSRLILAVADNGAGFDTTVEREGQGLMSMQRRADRLKGTLAIVSVSGAGTTITFSLPL